MGGPLKSEGVLVCCSEMQSVTLYCKSLQCVVVCLWHRRVITHNDWQSHTMRHRPLWYSLSSLSSLSFLSSLSSCCSGHVQVWTCLWCCIVCCSVCCSVLQCVLRCVLECVLECVAVGCTSLVLEGEACWSRKMFVTFTCSTSCPCPCVTVCVAVCCSMLQCVAVCVSMCVTYVWHDSLICATCRIHMCDMPHSYVWHDSFIYVKWLIDMCDKNQPATLFALVPAFIHIYWYDIHIYKNRYKYWYKCIHIYNLRSYTLTALCPNDTLP